MKEYIYNGTKCNANQFRDICLDAFPCLQHSRKRTIFEAIKRLAAKKGKAKALEFVSKVIEL